MFPKLQELVYGGHFLNAVQNRVDSTNIRPQLSNQEREQIKENIQRMYPLHFVLPSGTKFGIQVFETSTYRTGFEDKNGDTHKFDGNKVYLVCEIFDNKDVIKTLIWKGSPTIKDVQFYLNYTDVLRIKQRNGSNIIKLEDVKPFIK